MISYVERIQNIKVTIVIAYTKNESFINFIGITEKLYRMSVLFYKCNINRNINERF